MRVRLKKSWGQWSKGHIFADMPGGQARTLIARHIAEDLSADDGMKAKNMTSPVDRMMRSGRDLRTKVRASAQ